MSSRIRAQTRRTAEQPMCIGSGDRAAHKASTSDFFHLRCESHVYECTPKWTTNWRAGCGRAASPVRREGEAVRPLPTPILPGDRIGSTAAMSSLSEGEFLLPLFPLPNLV